MEENKAKKENLMEAFNKTKNQNQNQNQNALLEFKFNPPMQQPQYQQSPQVDPMLFNQYLPIYNTYNPHPFLVPKYQPVVNKYNITLNPNANVTRAVNIFEDVLPNDDNIQNNTFNTIIERLIIYRYLRSIFIKVNDGEELYINDMPNETNQEIINILSHVKLTELNPYNDYSSSKDPYTSLPLNYMMYRSCYPIRYNNTNNGIDCAKSSIGINIRLYKVTQSDVLVKNKDINERNESNLWRELHYYMIVRENIIKQKISPNFILLHAWYYSNNTGLDFKKFNLLRKLFDLNTHNLYLYQIYSKIRPLQEFIDQYRISIRELTTYYTPVDYSHIKEKRITYYTMPPPPAPSLLSAMLPVVATVAPVATVVANTVDIVDLLKTYETLIKDKNNKFSIDEIIKKMILTIENKMQTLSGIPVPVLINDQLEYTIPPQVLILLTETPTHNIFEWASKKYTEKNQVVKTMIQSGFHDDVVWESIIFQLLMAILVMIENKMMFTQFKLKKNVYIKDLKTKDETIGVWKYIYNNYEYYVQNYGYLLVIDSNYAEIENMNLFDIHNNKQKLYYKICNEFDKKDLYGSIIYNLYNIFSTFCVTFKTPDTMAPSNEFETKLHNFSEFIKDYIYSPFFNGASFDSLFECINSLPLILNKCFNFKFFHNRIGTFLTEQEKRFYKIKKRTANACTLCADENDKIYMHIGNIVDDKVIMGLGLNANPNPDSTINCIIDTSQAVQTFYKLEYDTLGKPDEILETYKLELNYVFGKQLKILETYIINLKKRDHIATDGIWA